MSRLVSTTLRLGDPAPPLVLPDLYGSPVSLSPMLEQPPAPPVLSPRAAPPGTLRPPAEPDLQSARARAARAAGTSVAAPSTDSEADPPTRRKRSRRTRPAVAPTEA